MKYILLFNEFNKLDREKIYTIYDNGFKIGFEIELDKTSHYQKIKNSIKLDQDYENDNISENYLTDLHTHLFKNYLSSFYKKWASVIKFEEDSSLGEDGVELITNPIESFSKAKEFINDFFTGFEKQRIFTFNETTSIHINISFKGTESINYLKLLLFLNEYDKDGNPGYAYRDFEERIKNKYCKPVKDRIFNSLLLKSNDDIFNVSNNEFEDIVNDIIKDFYKGNISKTSGMAIKNLKDSTYFEFRYIGNVAINVKNVYESMSYFAYLVALCKISEFHRNDYLKKLYKFKNTLKNQYLDLISYSTTKI